MTVWEEITKENIMWRASLIIISTKENKNDSKQKKSIFSLLLFLRWGFTVISRIIFAWPKEVRQKKKDVKIIEKHAIFTVKNVWYFLHKKGFFPSFLCKLLNWKFCISEANFFFLFLVLYALRQKEVIA